MQLNEPILSAHPLTGAERVVTPGLLREIYLAPRAVPYSLAEHLDDPDAPWAASLALAPAETATAVEAALVALMRATRRLDPGEIDASRLAPGSRLRRHVEALAALWRRLGDAIPPDLQAVRHALASGAGDALEPLPIVEFGERRFWNTLDEALRETLLAHHGAAPEAAARAAGERRAGIEHGALGESSLAHLQRTLDRNDAPRPGDASLAFYGLRDHAEEAEFAAALAQRMLDDRMVTQPHEIGVVVPDDAGYESHVARAFAAVGVPVSTCDLARPRRDLAGEALLHTLLALRAPAPAMALASLYLSPLMPWSEGIGRALALEVMNGRFRPRLAEALTGRSQRLFEALREPVHAAAEIAARLRLLGECLTGAESLRDDVAAARGGIARLATILDAASGAEPEWDALLREAAPGAPGRPAQERRVEGVTLIGEGEAPWRPVRRLIVLGCAGDIYPRRPPGNPFFLDSELSELERAAGRRVPGRVEAVARGLDIFRRQLCCAREGITFLRPWRDGKGTALAPCTGLSLVARTIEGVEEADRLFEDPRTAPPVALHPVSPLPGGAAPKLPQDGTIRLNRDLLALRTRQDGTPAPQSPSRLETLLVSPLAWLLAELDAEDRLWAAEEWDVLRAGSVAHDVIEHLFPKAAPLPSPVEIEARLPALLDEAIRRHAPFLAGDAWQVERETALREARAATLRWRKALDDNNLTIVENELKLLGQAHGIALAGRTDCLLRFPDGRILIVDHKKSATAKRRERLEAGFDLQLALYRAILARPTMVESDALAAIRAAPAIGVAYHLMNDGGVLAHGLEALPRPFESLACDISHAALALLDERLGAARAGIVKLNGEADESFFRKTAKLTPYALDASPLVRAFMRPDSGVEGDENDD